MTLYDLTKGRLQLHSCTGSQSEWRLNQLWCWGKNAWCSCNKIICRLDILHFLFSEHKQKDSPFAKTTWEPKPSPNFFSSFNLLIFKSFEFETLSGNHPNSSHSLGSYCQKVTTPQQSSSITLPDFMKSYIFCKTCSFVLQSIGSKSNTLG